MHPKVLGGRCKLSARATVGLCMLLSASCGDDGATGSTGSASTGGETSTGTDSTGPSEASTGTAPVTSEGQTTQSSSGSSGSTSTGDAVELPARLLVTADWRAKRISLVDLDAFGETLDRASALVAEIPLAEYEPGPLEVELTSDRRLAVVSVSPGFYDGIVGNTIGASNIPLDGTLLVIDLQSQTVAAELETAHVPLGIAIAPGNQVAYTANYGHSDAPGSTMSVIDLETMTVTDDIEVGARPEQVALSPDGTLGIINLAGDGTVRVFETSDPAGSLSVPLAVSGDPSDVDFIDGEELAVVANSLSPQNFTVIDLSDPSAPTVVSEGPVPGGFPYAATRIDGTTDFLFVLSAGDVSVLRFDALANPPAEVWRLDVTGTNSFPLGVVVDADAQGAIVAAPGANVLISIGLDGSLRGIVPWQNELGPTYAAIAG